MAHEKGLATPHEGLEAVHVIKIGGALVGRPQAMQALWKDVRSLQRDGTGVIVVHGGGPQMTAAAAQRGHQPTIIEGLDPQCDVNQQEIFGPVITLQPFRDEAEAIALANGTEYGLACTIWTENLSRAHRVAAQIDSGIAWVNCWLERDLRMPFGGVKSSGAGREGGTESLRFFTEPQNVCIQIASSS